MSKAFHLSPRREPRESERPSARASGYDRLWLIAIIALLFVGSGCTPPGKPVPPNVDAAKDFDSLYAANCAGCHGADGKYGSAPMLNEPLFLWQVSLEPGRTQVIAEGRKGTAMPPFDRKYGGPLTSEQVYILSNGMDTKWGHRPVQQTILLGFPGMTRNLRDPSDRGPAIYAQHCARCHGAEGRGGESNGKTVGAINDPAYLALTSNQYLWRVSTLGRRDLGCPDYSSLNNTVRLDNKDADDLTAFLASWRSQP